MKRKRMHLLLFALFSPVLAAGFYYIGGGGILLVIVVAVLLLRSSRLGSCKTQGEAGIVVKDKPQGSPGDFIRDAQRLTRAVPFSVHRFARAIADILGRFPPHVLRFDPPIRFSITEAKPPVTPVQ